MNVYLTLLLNRNLKYMLIVKILKIKQSISNVLNLLINIDTMLNAHYYILGALLWNVIKNNISLIVEFLSVLSETVPGLPFFDSS